MRQVVLLPLWQGIVLLQLYGMLSIDGKKEKPGTGFTMGLLVCAIDMIIIPERPTTVFP
jgi:hypothetical protein